jgi:hypothetical protein
VDARLLVLVLLAAGKRTDRWAEHPNSYQGEIAKEEKRKPMTGLPERLASDRHFSWTASLVVQAARIQEC